MSGRFANILEKSVKILILGIWTVIMSGLFAACVIQTVDTIGDMDVHFLNDSVFINLLWIVAAYLIMVGCTVVVKNYIPQNIRKWVLRNKNYIGIAVTAVVTVFLVWWITITQYSPAVDQAFCLQYAKEFLEGNKSAWVPGGYMSRFPFQNGLVFFDMLLIRIFGDNAFVAFQYINVLFFVIAVISLYVTCGYSFKKQNSIFIWLVLILFYPFAMYVVYCYGTMIGFSLAAVSVMFLFMYFDKRKLLLIIPCAISILLSIIVKPNYAIVLVGIVLYLLFDACVKKKFKSAAGAVAVVAIYLLGSNAVNGVFDNITGYHNEGIPKIAWVAMGLNDGGEDGTPGWCDMYNDWVWYKNDKDRNATAKESWAHVKYRLGVLLKEKRFVPFFYEKITSEWNNPTWECFYMQERESNTSYHPLKETVLEGNNQIYKDIMNVCQTLINFGVMLYIFMKWKNFQSLSVYELFNAVLMIGAFIFWAVWEAKSSYVAPYYYLILPYAVVGWKSAVSKTVLVLENAKIKKTKKD